SVFSGPAGDPESTPSGACHRNATIECKSYLIRCLTKLTSMPKNAPYQEGRFDYNECFFGLGGFLSPDANEEKHMMSLYLQVLAEEMARRQVVFGGPQPLRWLEPGIGDGSSTAKFITAMAPFHRAGFIIYGSDYQPESVERARINLPLLCPSNTRIGGLSV